MEFLCKDSQKSVMTPWDVQLYSIKVIIVDIVQLSNLISLN